LHLRLDQPREHQASATALVPDLPVTGAGEGIDALTAEPLVLQSDVVPLEILPDAGELVRGPVAAEPLKGHGYLPS
jgi:hypothetical protein